MLVERLLSSNRRFASEGCYFFFAAFLLPAFFLPFFAFAAIVSLHVGLVRGRVYTRNEY